MSRKAYTYKSDCKCAYVCCIVCVTNTFVISAFTAAFTADHQCLRLPEDSRFSIKHLRQACRERPTAYSKATYFLFCSRVTLSLAGSTLCSYFIIFFPLNLRPILCIVKDFFHRRGKLAVLECQLWHDCSWQIICLCSELASEVLTSVLDV